MSFPGSTKRDSPAFGGVSVSTSSSGGEGSSTRVDRRRLDAVFGEVLPETTSDERDPPAAPESTDRWYQENRPPHHDR